MRLILFPNQSDDFFINHLKDEEIKGTQIEYTYKSISKFKRILRKLHIKFLNYKEDIWYGDWKKLKRIDTVIIFDSVFNFNIIDFFKEKNSEIRIIFWFWNPIKDEKKLEILKSKNIEIWSFDLNDCREYKLKKNTQFLFKNNIDLAPLEKKKEKIYFIGADKGRISKIEKIVEDIKEVEKDIELKISILKDKKRKYSLTKNIEFLDYPISYTEIINEIKSSTIILEVFQDKQSGLTLRTLEALMFNKKLITTNQEIVNYDFYKKENIYIIGESRGIDEFLSQEYKIIDNKIKENYLFKTWLENFFKDEIF